MPPIAAAPKKKPAGPVIPTGPVDNPNRLSQASDVFAPPQPKPKLAGPVEPPHPVLQAAGFNGGIHAFNDKVEKVATEYTKAYGVKPGPGLALDVARSNVDPAHYATLFSVPRSPVQARLQGVLAQHDAANPVTTRPDGLLVAHTPLTSRLQALTTQPLAGPLRPTAPAAPDNAAELQKANPWVPVEAGFLPIASFGGLINALGTLDKHSVTDANGQVLVGGKTLDEYKTEAETALPQFTTGPDGKKILMPPQASISQAAPATDIAKAVTTVKQAQQELKDNYPAYFTDLAPDGNFNQDWVRALARFQSSAQYYRASTDQLAKDNHFNSPGEFEKAWQAKQDAIRKAAKQGAGAQLYEHVPLAFFGNGASVINYLDGDTHGWGFLNVPTVALDTIVGGAKTVLFGASAVVSESKAQAAAAVDYYHRILPAFLGGKGEGLREAQAHANKVALENPSYLRIFDPGLAANPTGALGAIDFVTNFAGDVILGNRLIVGGSAVKAGDEAALASNRYFKMATNQAFNSMRKHGLGGVGEASHLMQGGEGLNVAVAERIKAGDMTVAEYRGHVADLYHRGQTNIERPVTPVIRKQPTGPFGGKTNDALIAERDAIDARYNKLVDTLAAGEGTPKDYKVVTAIQNAGAKKLAAKGLPREMTVKEAFRSLAEAKLLRLLESRADEPVVQKLIADLDRSDAISKELALRSDASLGLHEGIVPREPPAGPTSELVALHASETPNGAVLSTLRDKALPNLSLPAQRMRAGLDQFDAGLRNSGVTGTNNAADLVSNMRSLFARAAPKNEPRRIYDARTPDDIYNWVVRNLDDRELANTARNDFVVARAKQDIPAIQDLNRNLIERYAATHPLVKGVRTPLESSGPESEAEGLASFKFVAGRQTDETGVFSRLERRAQTINNSLLDLARFHRQVIISGAPLPGGESLFWKHAVADTLRRWMGGGGARFALSAEQKAAKGEVEAFFKENPGALSDLSAQRASAEMGEVAWLTRSRPEQYLDFNTGEALGDAKKLEGAGQYLRHLVTDDALNAYRASSATDKTALFRHVWHSAFYQNLIAKSADFQKDAEALKASGATGDHLKGLLSDLKKTYAQDWADALWTRYRAVDDAGSTAGVPNAIEQAAEVARQHPGAKIDKQLGKFIADNNLAFDVREAPVKGKMLDGYMSRWISRLLTFNKLNRRTFFDHVFYDTFHDLAGAGWDRADAVTAASALAKQQTIYHMLDFSNMLQIEQNLRWLSYYATKHRLYWTWIARSFAHKPLLAAAVNDIAQNLDGKGNLDVTIAGHRLLIPAARLVWANSTEYPQTSPIVEGMFRFGAKVGEGRSFGNAAADVLSAATTTSGNVFTRQDQGLNMLRKYVGVLVGKDPATYGFAVDGMSPVQKAVFNDEMHNIILGYRADHDGRYPSEQYVVKAALLRATGNEVWRTNLFLPILPQTGKPTEIQQLIQQFGEIRDPKKRRTFLADHPQVSDYFGAGSDQQLYLHEQPLWDRFNAISKQRDLELAKVRAEIDKTGYTVEIARRVKEISAQYSVAIQRLRVQDAVTWKGDTTYPAGVVSDNGEIQTRGPWATKLDGDPVAAKAFLHEAFPGIGKQELDKHTIGQTIVDLQNEAARIRQLGWKALGYPDERHAKDRLSQINQTVDVFHSMPGNATSQMIDDYYTRFVDPYIKMRDQLTVEQSKTSSADKNVVYALNRAIKERYDHTVLVRDPVSGKDVRFPSPVSFGFTMLPPDQYKAALAGAVSGRWQDITGYEKTLLGVKTPPNVAEGWAAYQQTVQDWRDAPANAGHSLDQVQKASLARQIDKDYPGFYKDYLFAQQPKIDRYERTVLYQNLPPTDRQLFNEYIGDPAKALAQAIKQTGAGASRLASWRNYVKTELVPWIAGQKELAKLLQPYGPDFLNTLPSAG